MRRAGLIAEEINRFPRGKLIGIGYCPEIFESVKLGVLGRHPTEP